LLLLCAAVWVRAAVHCFALGADQLRSAVRTILRKHEWLCRFWPECWHDFHDLRDHVARFLYDNRIADAYVQACDLIFIMERCARDGGTGDQRRCQDRDGRDGSGASDL